LSDSSDKRKKQTTEDVLADDSLIARAKDGDLKAYDELVLKHNKRLYAMVYHMTKDRDDSYDLLQDIFGQLLVLYLDLFDRSEYDHQPPQKAKTETNL